MAPTKPTACVPAVPAVLASQKKPIKAKRGLSKPKPKPSRLLSEKAASQLTKALHDLELGSSATKYPTTPPNTPEHVVFDDTPELLESPSSSPVSRTSSLSISPLSLPPPSLSFSFSAPPPQLPATAVTQLAILDLDEGSWIVIDVTDPAEPGVGGGVFDVADPVDILPDIEYEYEDF